MSYPKHKSEESIQDYLETILILSKKQRDVRSIDIVNELGYTKPSVSVAMKNLKLKGFITISEEGFITLTPEGASLAEDVYERHSLLTEWLICLGVDPKVASEDACKMEHDMSAETFVAIKKCILEILKS